MTSTSHPEKLKSFPIRLDPARVHHPNTTVSEYLYSGFLEHLGRCIYGGIVDDPKNPSPAELLDAQEGGRLGVRKDVKKLVARNGELEIPMMRWPGGELCSVSGPMFRRLTSRQLCVKLPLAGRYRRY